jgi:MFS-type transporter involved in bile tolerance (Atg22 family)
MLAKFADVSGWVTLVSAVTTLVLGVILGALANIADRWHGRRARRGDLAAVGIRHDSGSAATCRSR